MSIVRQSARRLRQALLPSGLLLFAGYFLYHAFQGEHGLIALRALEQRASILETEAAALRERRRSLEQDTALLRPDALDPDMLDEQARRGLGLVHPDEVVILDPDRLLSN